MFSKKEIKKEIGFEELAKKLGFKKGKMGYLLLESLIDSVIDLTKKQVIFDINEELKDNN